MYFSTWSGVANYFVTSKDAQAVDYNVTLSKVECVLYRFGEVECPRTDREFEDLERFHEVWIDAIPARGTRLFAR